MGPQAPYFNTDDNPVTTGLDPAIHDFGLKTWMPGNKPGHDEQEHFAL
jgi:hypothetical protein